MRLRVFIAVFSMVLIVTPVITHAQLFSDTFSSGSNWNPAVGLWTVQNGEYTQEPTGLNSTINTVTLLSDSFEESDGATVNGWSSVRGSFSITHDSGDGVVSATTGNQTFLAPTNSDYLNWTNYIISVQAKRLGAADVYGYSKIYFRMATSTSNGYSVLYRNTGVLDLYKEVSGSPSVSLATKTGLAKDNNFHNIIISVYGQTIKVWVDKDTSQTPDITKVDSTYSAGTIGIGTQAWASEFNDLTVTQIPFTISATPANIYTDSTTTISISASASHLNDIQFNVTGPTGAVWSLSSPVSCADVSACSVIFPTDFTGTSLSELGTYELTVQNGDETVALPFEVIEKPILSFFGLTDVHVDDEYAFRLAALQTAVGDINSQRDFVPNFVVITGDLTQVYSNSEFANAKAALDDLSIPYYALMGNHDVEADASLTGALWEEYFGSDRFMYTWTSNDIVFIALPDSSLREPSPYDITQAQEDDFVASVLSANPNKTVFLLTHKSLSAFRDSGAAISFYDPEPSMISILEAYTGNVFNLSGHAHINSATSTNGINYLTHTTLADVGEYYYVEVYPDRVEKHLIKMTGYDTTYARGNWSGSTDSTHTAALYSYGLVKERQETFDLASKTDDILASIAIAGDSSWADYDYQTDITPAKEDLRGETVAGIIFRYSDLNNYYDVVLDTATSSTQTSGIIRLEKKYNGAVSTLSTTTADIVTGTTYQLKIEAVSNNINVYLDGVLKISTTDSTFDSGKIGFKTYQGSPTVYDNVIVNDLTPIDTTNPVPGTLVFPSITSTTITASSTDAVDETALAELPYQYHNITSDTYSDLTNSSWVATGLTPNTSYTFEVGVKDLAGNWATSSTFTTSTLAVAASPSVSVSISGSAPRQSVSPIVSPAVSPAVSPIPAKPLYSFTRDLEAGSEGKDVQALQDFLISKGYLASDKNTGYFGPLTRNALIQYQKTNNITPASGYLGPKTKTSFTNAPITKSVLTRTFTKGMQDPEIVVLQKILKTIPGIYPQGITSGYFGDLTLQAVKKFQIQYGIVSSPNETGYGVVGPKTREKLSELKFLIVRR